MRPAACYAIGSRRTESVVIAASLILSGGLGLGAYQAGAISALAGSGRVRFEAVAGASIGAFNAALVLGGSLDGMAARLRTFWDKVATEVAPGASPAVWPGSDTLRHLTNWTNTLSARLGGARGLFRLRPTATGEGASLYDLSPARELLAGLVDFDRLNGGGARVCIAATDVEQGGPVLFDTAAGERITVDHLLASGSLMPAFAPVRIGGRLLVDGGFSVNAPLEPFLSSARRGDEPSICVLIDLFAAAGAAPRSLEAAAGRANDLFYGNQTDMRLDAIARERALEARLDPAATGVDLIRLRCPVLPHDAGPERTYDFSRATLADRWAAGERDAAAVLALLKALGEGGRPGLRIHRVE